MNRLFPLYAYQLLYILNGTVAVNIRDLYTASHALTEH